MLTGFGLGIAAGLFLGELAAPLGIVADAFIRLLQMAVLPYVVVSLVGALGRLEPRAAITILRAGLGALLAVWGAAIVLVVAMPIVFPAWKAGAFFSTSLVEPRAAFDLVGQYIPANPFESLADNVVPAVVLFSIALGIAVMTVEGRAPFLADLTVLERALTRVNAFVVRLTPVGLFAIAASTVATLGIDELGRVQVYLVSFVAFGLVLTFGILPALVAAVTRLGHREVVRAAWDPVLTAFATGSLFVVLPQLVERAKRLVSPAGEPDDEAARTIDVLVPVSFTFPHAGKVLGLAFVSFAAWTSGMTLAPPQTATLVGAGLGAAFGSMNVAVPYLLDLLAVPADTFQLFLAVGVVTFRIATMVAAMHTLVLAVLASAAIGGRLTIEWYALARRGGAAALAVGATVVTLQLGFARLAPPMDAQARLVTERGLLFGTPAVVHREAPPPVVGAPSALARARERGVLRVGYVPDAPPLSYFNAHGALVGFDVDMAHAFARDLGLALELVPVDRDRLGAMLTEGRADVLMAGLAVTADRSVEVALSRPYLDFTMAFVVHDERRGDFARRERAQARRGLRIAIGAEGYYADMVRRYLPDATLIPVGTLAAFFARERAEHLDAMVHAAEMASAWTLLHPEFTVVVPQPDRVQVPVAYAVATGETELREVLDTWLLLKEADRTIDRLYRWWVLGLDEEHRAPRWSVVRNVLGWVE